MRILDYYVGIPLCLLGTVVQKIVGIFFRNHPLKKPSKLLFIELSEMGSVILADPAMIKAKRELKVDLFFVIFRKNSESLNLLHTVPRDNIFVLSDKTIFHVVADTVRFLAWTRRKNIDTVIDLELFSRVTALLSGFSGAENKVGFHAFYNEGLYRGDFLTHKVAYNPHQHIAKNFIALVNALLAEHEELPYSKTVIGDNELSLRKVAVDKVAEQMMLVKVLSLYPAYDVARHKLVIFNCNSSDMIPLRRWPKEYYIRLAEQILERFPRVVILLAGTRTELTGNAAIVDAVQNERCINFSGMTSLTDLLALYSLSELMVTNDSGPAHFASVTAMPVYVLFGPETPASYGPLGNMTPIYAGIACSPCVAATNHRKSVCNDNVCLQVITPEEVFALLQPVLERGADAVSVE